MLSHAQKQRQINRERPAKSRAETETDKHRETGEVTRRNRDR